MSSVAQQTAAQAPQRLAVRRRPAGVAAAAAAPPAARLRPLARRRELRRCRAAGQDPFNMPSLLFESEIFRKEMEELAKQLSTIQSMISKFADFDLEGKKIFLEQMEQLGDRFQVVLTRLQLSNDPLGNEVLRMQRVQMLEAGTNMAAAHQGFLAEMETMREIVKLEESCADPAMLQQIKQAYRDKFEQVARFNPLEILNDPQYMEGMMDPEAMKAMSEVADDPSKLDSWAHKPALYRLLKKVTGR